MFCQVCLLPTDPTHVGFVPVEYGSRPVTVAGRALLQAIMSRGSPSNCNLGCPCLHITLGGLYAPVALLHAPLVRIVRVKGKKSNHARQMHPLTAPVQQCQRTETDRGPAAPAW